MAKEKATTIEITELSDDMKALMIKIAELEAENLSLKAPAIKTVSQGELTLEQKREQFNNWMEERVPVQLFKDDKEYKDDLPVSVNGDTILIKRGYPVMIKRKHAVVLENQNRQQMVAIRTAEGLAGYKKND